MASLESGAPANVSLEELSQRKAEESQRKIDEFLRKKRERLNHPDCIVIAARVLDSHLLAQMLFSLDKAMNTFRIRAGSPAISIEDVSRAGQRIAAWIQKARDLAGELSPRSAYAVPLDVDSVKEKEILARARNTYAFVPSTPEGANLARTIKILDAAFLEYRIKAPMQDSVSVNAAFTAMRDLVKEFHDISKDMATRTSTSFTAPRSYRTYVSRGLN